MFFIAYKRFPVTSTNDAVSQIITLIQDPNFRVAVFSTSPEKADGTETPSDDPDTNWPYLSAAIRVEDKVYIFDSARINAARSHRASEVRDILDVAVNRKNVFFTQETVGFTAGLSPEAAAKRFTDVQLTDLTSSTRPHYWLKVGHGIPEHEHFRP